MTQQVLVIDGQHNAGLDLKRSLEELGYSVRTPTPGDQALYLSAYASGREPGPVPATSVISIGNVRIDLVRYRVFVSDQEISLTRKEFGILRCLAESAGKPVAPQALLERVWGPRFQHYIQTLRVHIGNLRQKIESASDMRIQAIRGVGYRLV